MLWNILLSDISCVVLMDQSNPDPSSVNNSELISMHLPLMNSFKGVFNFPWLGEDAGNPHSISANVEASKGALEKIFDAIHPLSPKMRAPDGPRNSLVAQVRRESMPY